MWAWSWSCIKTAVQWTHNWQVVPIPIPSAVIVIAGMMAKMNEVKILATELHYRWREILPLDEVPAFEMGFYIGP